MTLFPGSLFFPRVQKILPASCRMFLKQLGKQTQKQLAYQILVAEFLGNSTVIALCPVGRQQNLLVTFAWKSNLMNKQDCLASFNFYDAKRTIISWKVALYKFSISLLHKTNNMGLVIGLKHAEWA